MLFSDYASAILLGIIEGLTEFLPVSSTGHLILADALLGIEGPESKLFDIVIQLGAILAVCWVYRDRLFAAAIGIGVNPAAQRFVANILVAFLPAAVVGVLLYRFIKDILFSPWVVAVSLIVGGVLILVIERVRPRPRVHEVDQMRLGTALGIGCCQILAMIPGVSRAGATIMGALMLRVDRPTATEFSFFLAIPTMLGATVYDLYKNRAILSLEGSALIAIGFVVAFICALFVVRTLVGFVSRHGFAVFAWYRIALGAIALVLLTLAG
ncbi:MAG: undecaprenyl-diphosphate phosphatase [Alphaproteobacteria bacterium]|nr:undecaprenyl-diphosphate phosphatase [Alphaproteobacteria bacterium]